VSLLIFASWVARIIGVATGTQLPVDLMIPKLGSLIHWIKIYWAPTVFQALCVCVAAKEMAVNESDVVIVLMELQTTIKWTDNYKL
jgi:hypothetical protein